MRTGPLLILLFATAAAAPVDFDRQVKPLFQKKCIACHGPAQQLNGLRLDDGAAILKGGYAGPVVIAGKSGQSKLLALIQPGKRGLRMPPLGPLLTAEEVDLIRRWIDEGAKVPASKKAPAAARAVHWSYRSIERPAQPAVRKPAWVRNPIDAFVLARLESEGVAPSPEAPRATLIRRLSLDLTGLPPTPEEAVEFLADQRPDAYERLVDRLLGSPHYGEKWARHWLDLAHYADSDGYEKDLVRPHAWRYRHWLIQALNADLPFDQFAIEQLAGDLLPGATVEQRVATGFLRNTLTNREAGVDREEARFEQIINRVNTAGATWLGLTVGCAQCHDHKYDALTQKEYYQLFAFFHDADEENIDAPLPGELGPYLRALPEYEKKRKELLEQYGTPQLQAVWEARLREAIEQPGKTPEWDFTLTSMKAMFDGAVRVLTRDPAQRSPADARRLADYFVSTRGPAVGQDKAKLDRLKELKTKLDELDAQFPALSRAQVIARDAEAGPAHIHIKGDWRRKGIEVQPGTPAVLPPLAAGAKADRLALARWLVSRDNPLTARVTANRIWQEFFGRGLVRTADDFGTQGEKPSHPELLDWLAAELMENGWSLKQLQRQIVLSATYRQSSKMRPELQGRDPDNVLLARQSRLRLPAELVRDAALAAGGLLNTEVGGRSVRPPQPAGVAELGYANSVKWKESEGKDRYRRGLYIHFQRTTPYPMLMTFDAPDSNVSCTRRQRSNTSLQALTLLNDPVFHEAAAALAWRIESEAAGGFAERLDRAYRLCLARAPSAAERERLARYYDQQDEIFRRERGGAAGAPAWVGVTRVLLNLDEFITRE